MAGQGEPVPQVTTGERESVGLRGLTVTVPALTGGAVMTNGISWRPTLHASEPLLLMAGNQGRVFVRIA